MIRRPLNEKIDETLMNKLINARGISGNESEVRNVILKEVRRHSDSVKINKMGNLVVRKKGSGPKLMLAAHMDEIGLMVKSIDKYGKIYFSTVGGILPDVLLGERVHVCGKKDKIFGVITTDKISHDEDINERVEIEDMYVDTGYWKRKLRKFGVEVGNYIDFESVGKCKCHKKMVFGKALDDRIGCYILIQLIRKIQKSPFDLHFVFTVQEEMGSRGSKSSAWEVQPDISIVVDVTNANDNIENSSKILGNGPVLTIKDEEVISDRKLVLHIKKCARKLRIPLQLEVTDTGSTDALGISVFKTGVPTAIIGVPVRNIHSTFSMAHGRDINNLLKLLTKIISSEFYV